MDKDFMQYVYARCEKTLQENADYMKAQSECVDALKNDSRERYSNLSNLLQAKAEELCYVQGFNDAVSLLKGN